MKLVPALKIKGKILAGDESDSHVTLGRDHNISDPPEEYRGFTPDGKLFLNRKQALGWLKRYDPKTFNKLPLEAQKIGLHSEFLADAYGIEQKPLAAKIIERVKEEKEPEIDLSTKTAIVYDRGGIFLYAAEKLGEKYGKVMYYLADADAYPSSQKAKIGTGLKNIERVSDFWSNIDDVDIIYFFDCYDGELQNWLRSKGYIVFGSGKGEILEIDKVLFLEKLEEYSLPCPKTYVAEGLEDLLDYIEEHNDETLFLKNLNRGDFESRKVSSMAQSKPFFDDLRKRLGPACDELKVLVQHKIDAACEAGYDGFIVDGQFTKNCIVGYEIKDQGFVAKIFRETPEVLKKINAPYAEFFKDKGYRGNYSTEIRITEEGIPYYIDATCRVPSPPGELMCNIYENWAEATWQVANGELPVLKQAAQYGVEIILTSGWYEDHAMHVKIPPEYRKNVCLDNHMQTSDGEIYCIPNGNDEFFGVVVAWDDDLDKAIEKVLKIAESIEADGLTYDAGLFDKAKDQIEAGTKFGMEY